MNAVKRVPRKVWLLLACAALAALFGSSAGWFGPTDSRAAFLDAVSADLAKDSRVTVVGVDHAKGQLVVTVKPTNQTFTLVVTKIEAKTLPGGQNSEMWAYDWKDPAGNVVAVGRGMGSLAKTIHVDVPGLP